MEAISGSQDFSSGSQNRILDLNDKISFIPIICYEIIFFWKLIDTTNYNADILINITNVYLILNLLCFISTIVYLM